MKKDYGFLYRFLILFFVFFFQGSPLIQRFSVASVTPNLIFLLLFIYSIYLKDTEVITYSLIFGSLFDLLYMNIYGVFTLLFLGFAVLWQFLKKYLYTENKLIVTLFTAGYSLLFEVLLELINVALWQGAREFLADGKIHLIKACYNAFIGFFAFSIAKKIHTKKQEVVFDGK